LNALAYELNGGCSILEPYAQELTKEETTEQEDQSESYDSLSTQIENNKDPH